MQHTQSLRQNHLFRRLYYRGKSTACPYLVLYCMKNGTGETNRLGLTVSTKIGGAVQRNRVKRLFREAYRLNETEFNRGIDLVLVARARAATASYAQIEKALLRVLRDNPAAAAKR